jgi:hypothetical protein
MNVVSRSRTTAANTLRRGRPCAARSVATRRRKTGMALPSAIMREYFVPSRSWRHRSW